MKKSIVSLIVLLVLASTTLVNGQSYRINKLKYDHRDYIPENSDAYNPVVSGLCSVLVPGLGQMISGEVGRGAAFLGGSIGCGVLYGVGYAQLINGNSAGVGTMLLGMGAMFGVSIWSIVDAVKVAKVNNMYIRDLRNTSSLELEFSPYVSQVNINNQIVSPIGLTMRVIF